MHGSYEALKYGTTLDGLADLTGGVTESISIKTDTPTGQLSQRLLSRLLCSTSIVTAVANPSAHSSSSSSSSGSSTGSNKENNNNTNNNTTIHNGGKNHADTILNGDDKGSNSSSPKMSRNAIDRSPNGILLGISYKICSVDKVIHLTFTIITFLISKLI